MLNNHHNHYSITDLISAIRSQRVRAIFGISEEEQSFQKKVWSALNQVENFEDLAKWTASVRFALLGRTEYWEVCKYDLDPDVAKQARKKGRFLLGEAIMNWVLDDFWIENSHILVNISSSSEAIWTSEDLSLITKKSSDLAIFFGLKHLRVTAGWSPQKVSQAIDEAFLGLEEMSFLLNWNPKEIGSHRIGLSWDLNHDLNSEAHYDILTSTINVTAPGSFAHEWAHALDLVIGEEWDPSTHGKMRYASHQSDWFLQSRSRWEDDPIPGTKEGLMFSIAKRDELPTSSLAAMKVSQNILQQLPEVLKIISQDLPHPEWQPKVSQRLNAYQKWLNLTLSPEPNLEQIRSQWDRWKLGCEVAWSQPEDDVGYKWSMRWFRTVKAAEKIAFGAWPRHTTWFSWSKSKDEENGKEYWSTAHELWARSFHAAVFRKSGKASWYASSTLEPDIFPMENEAEDIKNWWNEILPYCYKIWTKNLKNEIENPAHLDVENSEESIVYYKKILKKGKKNDCFR